MIPPGRSIHGLYCKHTWRKDKIVPYDRTLVPHCMVVWPSAGRLISLHIQSTQKAATPGYYGHELHKHFIPFWVGHKNKEAMAGIRTVHCRLLYRQILAMYIPVSTPRWVISPYPALNCKQKAEYLYISRCVAVKYPQMCYLHI